MTTDSNSDIGALPPLFTLLIIAKSKRNVVAETVAKVQAELQSLVKDALIFTKYEDDLDSGMLLWQQHVFDLTLIQTDIEWETTSTGDGGGAKWHHAHAALIGSSTLASMEDLKKNGSYYGFLEDTCAVERLPSDNSIADSILQRLRLYLKYRKQFSPEQVVARFISFYRHRSAPTEELTKALSSWRDSQLASLDGYLLHTKETIPALREIASDDEDSYVYFTCRKPGEDIVELPEGYRFIYLGPVSRDDKRPLWLLINYLFPMRIADVKRQELKNKQCELLPLDTGIQRFLLYRSCGEEKRQTPFRGPEVPKPERVQQDTSGTDAESNSPKQPAVQFHAAATPLTGVSTICFDDAKKTLIEKVHSLLQGPFASIVLKTVYQDDIKKSDARWPSLQAQSHHRTRCLRAIGHPRTLWNTGITALEMFTPKMLNEFLQAFAGTEKCEGELNRVTVSLGSKYPKAKDKDSHSFRVKACKATKQQEKMFINKVGRIWDRLFNTVFRGVDDTCKRVEINVRHYLRENIAFHVGGDEYLSPSQLCGPFSRSSESSLMEFHLWLTVLQQTAKKHNKRLILKFPYRSDILAYVWEMVHYHASLGAESVFDGICLINAYKSAVCDSQKGTPYTPAWWSMGDKSGWPDAQERDTKYQMSGEMLNASRNQLMLQLLNGLAKCGCNLEVYISGGIVSKADADYCVRSARKLKDNYSISVQIGTWALLNLNLSNLVLSESCDVVPPREGACKPEVKGCHSSCGNAANACTKGVFKKNGQKTQCVVNDATVDKCVGCGACKRACVQGKVRLVPRASVMSEVSQEKPCAETLVPNAVIEKNKMVAGPIVSECGHECGLAASACSKGVFKSGLGEKCLVDDERVGNCDGCQTCVASCPENCVVYSVANDKFTEEEGGEQQMLGATKVEEQTDKAIGPRICYWLHDRCDGCGDCSKSFYCDSFLDRQGKNRHPIMDSRNCTGCGLCAQICHKGALQLFKPMHIAVLVSSMSERSDILRTLMIPHLTFDPCYDHRLFIQNRRKGKDSIEGCAKIAASFLTKGEMPTKDKLLAWSKKLWEVRLRDDPFILALKDKELYTDLRQIQEGNAGANASNLYDSLNGLFNSESLIAKSVGLRAFIWSQLIWSDPGQVLWNSPILVVRTTVENMPECHRSPRNKEKVTAALNWLHSKGEGRNFTVVSHYAVLLAGKVVATTDENNCHRTDGLHLSFDKETLIGYVNRGLGVNRLAGLDIRACPSMLKRNGKNLSVEDIRNVAGLPWGEICKMKPFDAIREEVEMRIKAVGGL